MTRRRIENALLAALLTANFLGLTFQVRTGIDLPVRDALLTAFSRVQSLKNRTTRSARTWAGVVWDGWRMRAEREALAARVARLEWELTVQRGLLVRARGFGVLDEAAFTIGEPVPAEVVGVSASPFDSTVTVNRGSFHGIRRDSPVMSPAGLVGRVVAAGAAASQVQLITGHAAAVASLTAEGRVRGIVRGGSMGLRLDFVSAGQRVAVGESVISSGLDGIYPKGLVVGKVVRVQRGTGMLLDIGVESMVDFGSLERVFLLPPFSGVEVPEESELDPRREPSVTETSSWPGAAGEPLDCGVLRPPPPHSEGRAAPASRRSLYRLSC